MQRKLGEMALDIDSFPDRVVIRFQNKITEMLKNIEIKASQRKYIPDIKTVVIR